MANKRGEAKTGTTILIIALVILAAYFFIPSVKTTLDGFLAGIGGAGTGGTPSGNQNAPLTNTADCPTTGVTTLTINVQDELATTATNRDVEYFIFNGNSLIKEGTTGSDGTVAVDVACGKDYKVLLVNTTNTAGTGAYSKVVDVAARTAAQTINERVVLFGRSKILGIENPADPSGNANVSIGASATKNFNLKFSANYTGYGFNRPIIMCQANVTEITDIVISSFSDGTSVVRPASNPKRVSANAGYAYYGFEYPKLLAPKDGVISAIGTITAGSTAPATAGNNSMTCIIIDQATWKTSSYKTAKSIDEGFKTGPENTETTADVGGPDAQETYYFFVHSGGY